MAENDSRRRNVLIGVTVICLLVAGVVTFWTLRSDAGVAAREYQWFYDLGSDALFVVPAKEIPPIEVPSGAKGPNGWEGGVKAYVYSCGECSDGERFTAFLGTYSPEVRQTLVTLRDYEPGKPLPAGVRGSPVRAAQQLGEEELWVTTPESDSQWVKASSPAGMAIRIAPAARCEGGAPKQCYPQGDGD